jgi:hypothetical protein
LGYHARWLAVRNVDLSTCLSTIGLRQEAILEGPVVDPGWYSLEMPGGWRVVIGDGLHHPGLIEEACAKELSKGTQAVHFETSDAAMFASLVMYGDQQELWSIVHDGSNGNGEPVVTGDPPPIIGEILDKCRAEKATGASNVDYLYEAAPEIAKALTGFRHDQTLGDGEHLPILVLEAADV